MVVKCNYCGNVWEDWELHSRSAEPEDGKIRGSQIPICPMCKSDNLEEITEASYIPDYTPKEFKERMREIVTELKDKEDVRFWGADIMCDLLRSMGYGEGVSLYEKARR